MGGMKTPAIVCFGLTLILVASGIIASRDTSEPAAWLGAFLPAAAMLYLTIRVAREVQK
jgi:hypothetical protein